MFYPLIAIVIAMNAIAREQLQQAVTQSDADIARMKAISERMKAEKDCLIRKHEIQMLERWWEK